MPASDARPDASRVAVCCDGVSCEAAERARQLADQLALPLTHADDDTVDALLTVTDERVELRAPSLDVGPVSCDFVSGPFGYRRRGHLRGELLIKAVGYRGEPLRVIDATAGLGRDAVMLALAGCTVTAVERHPVIAALLADGLRRACDHDDDTRAALRDRLVIVQHDARDYLASLDDASRPDVIYLDPMFPHRSKSALVKKEMRVCRVVTGDDPDADDLLRVALTVARRRVTVKSAAHAPSLAGPTPTVTHRGKAVRYDVYAITG
ncbi:MAG: rRNA methyltransferase [Phycisphaera sp.]|nr:rRNA methyltransferase [Phycisphaera sp.]